MRALLFFVALILAWPVAADDRFPCYSMDEFLAAALLQNEAVLAVGGSLGALLAAEHRRGAPVRYELSHPVRTVLLLLKADGSVVMSLQIGSLACAPLEYEPKKWRDVSSELWGRGA